MASPSQTPATEAGADVFVAGSGVYAADTPNGVMDRHRMAEQAGSPT